MIITLKTAEVLMKLELQANNKILITFSVFNSFEILKIACWREFFESLIPVEVSN